MTREELLRVLDFVDSLRGIAETRTSLATTDARWNIISYAMRRHLQGRLLTVTSVASAAGVPYGTAMRRITELTDEGYLLRRPRSKSGKSFSLHPTRRLIEEFESYALQTKALVGKTFGFNTGEGELGDFYFGGGYMASRILSYPAAMRAGIGFENKVRILSPVDPTFKTLSDFSSNLNELCGTEVEIVTMPLDALHDEILDNHGRGARRYDLVAVDLPWIGQLASAGAIEPLDDLLVRHRYNASDFHSAAWKGSAFDGRHYGLPIQPTPELLFCRQDLFDEVGLSLPTSAEEVLFAARALHRSAMNLSGIVMNFGRGLPVAHSFVQTLADFGQPVIDLAPVVGGDYDVTAIRGTNCRPMIDTEAGHEAADFLLSLLPYAHRDSLKCNWDRRIALYARGHAAMTYGWTIRAGMFEADAASPAQGRTAYLAHPPGNGARSVSPIGGFSLAIPTGLDAACLQRAWKMLEYLTRPEMLKWYVLNGNPTSPRFSTSADPEVQAASPVIKQVDAMERRGELQIWPRPPVPEFHELLCIVAEEIHPMLCGEVPVAQALRNAQNRGDALMRANGRY
ncbi:ABC transporter substrate-binding protein [Roseivivax isoporae]|uniref:ABC transporter substrate-binding protein n=1 Tax=Roseivivax isoporae LMG 25204 TaxID=1449351 RepID=X7FC34_9RHOB|nr:extracellular solute-binding protein [Roseivivax isoporae]ETX30380.1 ABC transporter substrate-binding protein [Roseivivax isoporae LMG 25204]